jgi:hypothetical protein
LENIHGKVDTAEKGLVNLKIPIETNQNEKENNFQK